MYGNGVHVNAGIGSAPHSAGCHMIGELAAKVNGKQSFKWIRNKWRAWKKSYIEKNVRSAVLFEYLLDHERNMWLDKGDAKHRETPASSVLRLTCSRLTVWATAKWFIHRSRPNVLRLASFINEQTCSHTHRATAMCVPQHSNTFAVCMNRCTGSIWWKCTKQNHGKITKITYCGFCSLKKQLGHLISLVFHLLRVLVSDQTFVRCERVWTEIPFVKMIIVFVWFMLNTCTCDSSHLFAFSFRSMPVSVKNKRQRVPQIQRHEI